MKKIFTILIVISLISTSVLLSFANVNDYRAPDIQQIKEKQHYKKIIGIKEKNEFDTYVNTLNKSELILTIAEFADELEKANNPVSMRMFADVTKNKLINELTESDYISFVENKDYSDLFKAYMIDCYSYSKHKNNKKNTDKFDNSLRTIVKDSSENQKLRFYALASMDNLDNNDIDMLKKIIDSKEQNEILKARSLKELKKINEQETYPIIKQIIKDHKNYSDKEVGMSIDLLTRSSSSLISELDGEDHKVDIIENFIKESNNYITINSSIRSLGNIKTQNSVKAVINNREKVQENSVIAYYINKNYLTVEKMLEITNDIETIKIGLECVGIAPFKSFMPKLEILANNCSDEEVKNQAKNLITKVNEHSYERNIKWDEDYN